MQFNHVRQTRCAVFASPRPGRVGSGVTMSDELWNMTAVEAVARLKKRELSPLDLIEASARRIAEIEPAVNALPTLCLDRARDHARRLTDGRDREAEEHP